MPRPTRALANLSPHRGNSYSRRHLPCLGDCLMRLLGAAIPPLMVAAALGAGQGHALEAIPLRGDVTAIDITEAVEERLVETDRIVVTTPPDASGIVRRMEVRALRAGSKHW